MRLFEPASIGTLELANRFVRSATAERLSDAEGRPLPALSDIYRALAEGGVGLIITGHAYVHPSGRCHAEMSGIYKDELIADWSEVVAAVHEAGGKIAMQINHGGRQCNPDVVEGPLWAPSPVPVNREAPRPEELGDGQIEILIRAFADAAGRAKEAGFDAVQLHGAHGYLISAFHSPAANWRHDAWGGTLARRTRFLEEVVSAARDVVGNDYPLLIKLGVMDFVRDGLTEKEGLEIVSHLRDMGLDAVEISGGIGPGNTRSGITSPDKEAYFLPTARKARYMTDLPILLVGGLRSRAIMDMVLEEESADLISLCRPLIREPDLPNRMQAGQARASCMSCGRCWPLKGEVGISCHYPVQE